eukprot:tig00001164_g7399.t1
MASAFDADTVFALLASKRRLDRERGVVLLRDAAARLSDDELRALHERTLELVRFDADWEPRHGGLLAAALLVSTFNEPTFALKYLELVPSCLEDDEMRTRLACAELLEVVARRTGSAAFETLEDYLLDAVDANFEREGHLYDSAGGENDDANGYDSEVERADARFRSNLASEGSGQDAAERPASPRPSSPRSPRSPRAPPRKKATSLRIESEGWRALEASMRALQHIFKGAGSALAPYLGPAGNGGRLLELIGRACSHGSRFVREIGFDACDALLGACDAAALHHAGPVLSLRISLGLTDNWSAVRLASSRAARSFAIRWQSTRGSAAPATAEQLIGGPVAVVLPSLALNRYYVAEGVRLHAAETWRLVVGDAGRAVVTGLLPQVSVLYQGQLRAANYFAREAACHVIGELAAKIDAELLRPFAPQLLSSLVAACDDESWPVRVAAGVAASRFAGPFPEETRGAAEGSLYAFWEAHLCEAIPSIREDAAVAMAAAARGLGPAAVRRALDYIANAIGRAKEQPPDRRGSDGAGNPPQGRTGPSGQRVFDVGDSMGPSSRLPGYTSYVEHRVRRPAEPWEVSDGAVYLLREMAGVAPEEAATLLPRLAELPGLSHAAAHQRLAETVWAQLPTTARALGPRRLKPHLELFLPPLLRTLSGPLFSTDPARVAAEACARELARVLGPSILRGRLALLGPDSVATWDRLFPCPDGVPGPSAPSLFPVRQGGSAPGGAARPWVPAPGMAPPAPSMHGRGSLPEGASAAVFRPASAASGRQADHGPFL